MPLPPDQGRLRGSHPLVSLVLVRRRACPHPGEDRDSRRLWPGHVGEWTENALCAGTGSVGPAGGGHGIVGGNAEKPTANLSKPTDVGGTGPVTRPRCRTNSIAMPSPRATPAAANGTEYLGTNSAAGFIRCLDAGQLQEEP